MTSNALRSGAPWRTISFTAQFNKRISDSDYTDPRDDTPGYPAFIRERKIDTDEILAKLVVKPAKWLKTTLSYRLIGTDYFTATDALVGGTNVPGGRVFAGDHDGHVFSVNATMTPFRRLHFATTFSYIRTRTVSDDNHAASIAPYKGDTFSVIGNANFALNQSTDLQALYSFSRADFGQDNFDGVPLGIAIRNPGCVDIPGVIEVQAATEAGAHATQAATHAGTWSTMLAGGGGLIVGMFLALALTATRS